MKIHELKTWPEHFKAVVDGIKTFDIRENDRNFQVDDRLVLKEFIPCPDCMGSGRVWDVGDMCSCGCPGPDHGRYTGRICTRRVTYITNWRQHTNHVVMAITPDTR